MMNEIHQTYFKTTAREKVNGQGSMSQASVDLKGSVKYCRLDVTSNLSAQTAVIYVCYQ